MWREERKDAEWFSNLLLTEQSKKKETSSETYWEKKCSFDFQEEIQVKHYCLSGGVRGLFVSLVTGSQQQSLMFSSGVEEKGHTIQDTFTLFVLKHSLCEHGNRALCLL